MKTHILFLAINFLTISIGISQVAINNTGDAPNSSAMLDIQSTSKGMLVPRMTTNQRNAIATPVSGLQVFDLITESFWYYNTDAWHEVISSVNNHELISNNGNVKIETDKYSNVDRIYFTSNNYNSAFFMENGMLVPEGTGYSVFFGYNAGLNDDRYSNYNVYIGTNAGKANVNGH